MAPGELQNLSRSGVLKREPGEQREFDGLVAAGISALNDAQVAGLSDEGRFQRAYDAAHAFSLAALRWHGFRPDNKRYAVFLALSHTLGVRPETVRILGECHRRRNLAEYEGAFEVDERFLKELLQVAKDLLQSVRKLGPVA